ncbi:MAG: pyrroline-5-carboxylate reductase [Proteobacteria bacterium]|nr:pyrroline-5-carboxylate reductase [Pseudomonadota bacterium]MCH9758199.1 pyrroline-5-carboxylate reductase [Pseudomonadota bacterium]
MKIAFIGGGHMAHALIAGLYQSNEIIVAEHNAERRQKLAEEFKIETCAVLPADAGLDVLVLAVRPPQAQEACAGLPPAGCIMSVIAGLRCQQLAQWTERSLAEIIRIMPNTPAQVQQGMTFAYADHTAAEVARNNTAYIFKTVGQFAWVREESLLDSVTAVSGSGPAYIYYIIEAMQQAAQRFGLAPAEAQQAVLQTLRGACAMVEENPQQSVTELWQAVAVPGGTTARALAVMQEAQMQQTIIEAMVACRQRAQAMGEELAK